MHLVASVRLSFRLHSHGRISGTQGSILGARLCRVQERARVIISHYQSITFVCVSNNHADAVDQHLISASNLRVIIALGCTWQSQERMQMQMDRHTDRC